MPKIFALRDQLVAVQNSLEEIHSVKSTQQTAFHEPKLIIPILEEENQRSPQHEDVVETRSPPEPRHEVEHGKKERKNMIISSQPQLTPPEMKASQVARKGKEL